MKKLVLSSSSASLATLDTLTSDEDLGVFFDALFDEEANGAARKKAAKRAAREKVVNRDLERRDARRAKSRLKRDESYR